MRIPRTRGALTGLVILVLGAWGGLIPFVGPYFDYQIGAGGAWTWTSNRLFLDVIPGVAAMLGGLMLITGTTRASTRLGGWIALAAGIWFVTGPTVSMLWENGRLGTGAATGSTGVRVLEWLGFFYATGVLIAALAGYAIGMLTGRPVTAEAAVPSAERPASRDVGRRPSRFRRRGFRRVPQRDVEADRAAPDRAAAE
jgi:hypothetical protein